MVNPLIPKRLPSLPELLQSLYRFHSILEVAHFLLHVVVVAEVVLLFSLCSRWILSTTYWWALWTRHTFEVRVFWGYRFIRWLLLFDLWTYWDVALGCFLTELSVAMWALDVGIGHSAFSQRWVLLLIEHLCSIQFLLAARPSIRSEPSHLCRWRTSTWFRSLHLWILECLFIRQLNWFMM